MGEHPAARLTQGALNVRLGASYLSRLLKRFDGKEPFALAAYNAGPSRVIRWRGVTFCEARSVRIWPMSAQARSNSAPTAGSTTDASTRGHAAVANSESNVGVLLFDRRERAGERRVEVLGGGQGGF